MPHSVRAAGGCERVHSRLQLGQLSTTCTQQVDPIWPSELPQIRSCIPLGAAATVIYKAHACSNSRQLITFRPPPLTPVSSTQRSSTPAKQLNTLRHAASRFDLPPGAPGGGGGADV